MTKREEYERAKKVLARVQHELDRDNLSPEQRAEMENAAAVSGLLLSPWLPMDWGRRLVMAALVLLGLQQAAVGNYQTLIWWLALPFFSPRIVGELAYFAGKVSAFFRS